MEVGDSTGQSGLGRVFLTPMTSPWTLTKASQGPSQVFKVPRCTGVLFADLLSSLPPSQVSSGARRHLRRNHPRPAAEKMGPLIRLAGSEL